MGLSTPRRETESLLSHLSARVESPGLRLMDALAPPGLKLFQGFVSALEEGFHLSKRGDSPAIAGRAYPAPLFLPPSSSRGSLPCRR